MKPRHAFLSYASGPEVGIGHQRRVESIGRWLASRNWHVSSAAMRFDRGFFRGAKPQLNKIPQSTGSVLWIVDAAAGDPEGTAHFVENAIRGSSETTRLCVVDSPYRVLSVWDKLRTARSSGLQVVPHGQMGKHKSGAQRWGIGYTVLAPNLYSLAEIRKQSGVSSDVNTVLITAGGVDAYGVTEIFIEALNGLDSHSARVQIVVGPYFSERRVRRIEVAARESRHSVELIRNLGSITQVIDGVDLAFSAGGITKTELSALGVPTLVLDETESHALDSRVLQQLGSVVRLGLATQASIDEVRKTIRRVSGDVAKRRAMSEVGVRAFSARECLETIIEMEEV